MQKSDVAGRARPSETSPSEAVTKLNEIIERLEKATGPDRELDAHVWSSVCKVADFGPFTLAEGCRAGFDPQDDGSVKLFIYGPGDAGPNYVARERSLKFTASVDAALTLVPSDRAIDFTRYSELGDPKTGKPCGEHHCKARVWANYDGLTEWTCESAPTPALALCIAALRARASRDTPSSPEETEASQAKPPHTPVED